MLVRVGCDTVHIPRFKTILDRTPSVRDHLFVEDELDGRSSESLAGVFAVKEAVLKALELKPGCWRQMQVIKDENGRPRIQLDNCEHEWTIVSQDISISHDGDAAFAVAVFLIE